MAKSLKELANSGEKIPLVRTDGREIEGEVVMVKTGRVTSYYFVSSERPLKEHPILLYGVGNTIDFHQYEGKIIEVRG